MVKLNQLSVGYHGSKLLVDNADARFDGGRLVALLGRNGAGKSSLLRVIAGLDKPKQGTVEVNGAPIDKLSVADRAKTIAFVTTQRVRVPNLRCRDVVGLGRAPYTDWAGRLAPSDMRIVDSSLEAVGMADYADRTMDRMSDGECQRVMIARALAQDTPLMLLDEPTSFLDLPNRYELCLLLQRLAHEQQKCIIFSTHELDIALNLCDDIALIDTPRLISGPVPDVVASGAIQRLFFSNCPSIPFPVNPGAGIFREIISIQKKEADDIGHC